MNRLLKIVIGCLAALLLVGLLISGALAIGAHYLPSLDFEQLLLGGMLLAIFFSCLIPMFSSVLLWALAVCALVLLIIKLAKPPGKEENPSSSQ